MSSTPSSTPPSSLDLPQAEDDLDIEALVESGGAVELSNEEIGAAFGESGPTPRHPEIGDDEPQTFVGMRDEMGGLLKIAPEQFEED
ncbi:MAG: hypothetical protein OEY44_00620 [Candidatus Peregrinibacteria bacterium]|nr:hypothetical protein [Candidatus Peregrinibacteria bacterium]